MVEKSFYLQLQTAMFPDIGGLYYIHKPPINMNETFKIIDIFDKLKKEGKILATGISVRGVGKPNVDVLNIEECETYIKSGRVDALQLIFSVLRQRMRAIFPMARKHGVAIIARTVLENGFLSGKYNIGHIFPDTDHRTRWPQLKLDTILNEAKYIYSMNNTPNKFKLSEIAIGFVQAEEEIDSMVLGVKTPLQVQETFLSPLKLKMPKELYDQLVSAYSGRTDDF